jgi:hypothetical protein
MWWNESLCVSYACGETSRRVRAHVRVGVGAQFAIGIIGEGVEVDVNSGSSPFRFGPGNPGGAPEAPIPLVDAPIRTPVPVHGGVSTLPAVIPSDVLLRHMEEEVARLRASEAAARASASVLDASTYASLPAPTLDAVIAHLERLLAAATLEHSTRLRSDLLDD